MTQSTKRDPNSKPSFGRWTIPVGLGLLMAVTVGYGVLAGPLGEANAIPAPSQYTTPSTNNSNPFADPLVIAGVVLGILVIVFAVMLAMRLRGGRMGGDEGAPEDGEPSEEEDLGTEGADDEEENLPDEPKGEDAKA